MLASNRGFPAKAVTLSPIISVVATKSPIIAGAMPFSRLPSAVASGPVVRLALSVVVCCWLLLSTVFCLSPLS